MRIMQHPERHTAEHQFFHPGITVSGDDNQIHTIRIGVIHNCLRRRSFKRCRFYVDSFQVEVGLDLFEILVGPDEESFSRASS